MLVCELPFAISLSVVRSQSFFHFFLFRFSFPSSLFLFFFCTDGVPPHYPCPLFSSSPPDTPPPLVSFRDRTDFFLLAIHFFFSLLLPFVSFFLFLPPPSLSSASLTAPFVTLLPRPASPHFFPLFFSQVPAVPLASITVVVFFFWGVGFYFVFDHPDPPPSVRVVPNAC